MVFIRYPSVIEEGHLLTLISSGAPELSGRQVKRLQEAAPTLAREGDFKGSLARYIVLGLYHNANHGYGLAQRNWSMASSNALKVDFYTAAAICARETLGAQDKDAFFDFSDKDVRYAEGRHSMARACRDSRPPVEPIPFEWYCEERIFF